VRYRTEDSARSCDNIAVLHEFLDTHRADLVDRCRMKVALRSPPPAAGDERTHGIPMFLDQLITTLRVEQSAQPLLSRAVSGTSGGGVQSSSSEIGRGASLHGRELLRSGFTIDQVVHDYGDLCQAITDLAFERRAPIEIDEFRTLNRCLDNAIAGAVTAYNHQRDFIAAGNEALSINERLGFLAHELRNHINTATLAVTVIKAGNVGLGGATGAVLDRSLVALRNLIDKSLAEVRMTAGRPTEREIFSLAAFIAEVKLSALLEAQVHEATLSVCAVDRKLAIEADRDLLLAAVGNLLQNAFKFTHRHTQVSLSARKAGDRILIEVADCCGGLPAGDANAMFLPFTQANADRSGLGLGLSIARRSVEENGGILRVRDVPGTGCVFAIDLPLHLMPETVPA